MKYRVDCDDGVSVILDLGDDGYVDYSIQPDCALFYREFGGDSEEMVASFPVAKTKLIVLLCDDIVMSKSLQFGEGRVIDVTGLRNH